MMIWIRRQVRRVMWLVQDFACCIRGLRHLRQAMQGPDALVGIAILKGDSWALGGASNTYQIRLVNDTAADREVELNMCGQVPGACELETRASRLITGGSACDLYLVTDWESRFEFMPAPPSPDRFRLLEPRPLLGRCRVTATLSAGGRSVDEQVIVQDLTA